MTSRTNNFKNFSASNLHWGGGGDRGLSSTAFELLEVLKMLDADAHKGLTAFNNFNGALELQGNGALELQEGSR